MSADSISLKPDSSIRRGKPGRSRMHPAGNTETPVRDSGLLSSSSRPMARPRRTRSLESKHGVKL